MSIQTCPTETIDAPAHLVWRLLTTPTEISRWTGLTIASGPDHPLQTGNQLVFRGGLGAFLQLRFHVINADPDRRLTLDIYFPFGIVNHEVVVITRVSDGTCRVTYN